MKVDFREIEDVCREFAGLHRLVNTKISTWFKIQYFLMYKDGGFDLLSVNDMVRSIDNGEKIEGTKKAEQFKYEPLNRFYHQHVFDLKYLPRNIVLELNYKNSKTKPELKTLFKRYIEKPVDE